MAKYRKKPVVIEAVRFTGETLAERGNSDSTTLALPDGVVPLAIGAGVCACGASLERHGAVATLEGRMKACPGDWIITGVKGERYPCKPDIFAATYEAVEP
jgi:hypothetical protein